MLCPMCGEEVVRLKFLFRPNNKTIEGCRVCTDGLDPSIYSTEKRSVFCKDGQSFSISAAHTRDMNMRRVDLDLKTVYRDTGRSYMFMGDK